MLTISEGSDECGIGKSCSLPYTSINATEQSTDIMPKQKETHHNI